MIDATRIAKIRSEYDSPHPGASAGVIAYVPELLDEIERLAAALPSPAILRGAAKLLRLAGEQIYAERIQIDADRVEAAQAGKGKP